MMHILFGNVLGAAVGLLLPLAASLVALLVVWLAYRPLMLYAFDPAGPSAWLQYGVIQTV